MNRNRILRILPWVGSVMTGLLMASAFPPLAWQDAAWVALVPLLLACRFVTPTRAARLGFLAGAVFWLLSVFWLTHVTVVGWIILSLYCALYVSAAALVFAWLVQVMGHQRWWLNLGLILVTAVVWAGLEYLRSTLFSGFPWNPLGVSQYQNLPLIQGAAWGGVYSVSALAVVLNTSIALTIIQYIDGRGRRLHRPHVELMLGLGILAVVFSHGWRTLRHPDPQGPTVRVALVQPAIPQNEKWDRALVDTIYERLGTLTDNALRTPGLHLVVWPETAVPDDIRRSPKSYDLVYNLATNGVPMLVGSMDTEWRDDLQPVYYNSSFLFDTYGSLVQGYDKRHLVVFGEYVPFQRVLPFLKAMTPIQASFTPGSTSTVFRLETPDVRFSALICFEDTVAKLARISVRNGAQLLVNQTNDAWFDPSSASRQHMAHCVFRCVENRVPAVRAGNTGVSCFIDPYGRVSDVLERENGVTVFQGFVSSAVAVRPPDAAWTYYTRRGDVFGASSALVSVTLLLAIVLPRLRRRRPAIMLI